MNKLVLSGDLVGFSVGSGGIISTTGLSEPLPEAHERVSHLRVSKTDDIMASDFSRSMFRIISDNQVRRTVYDEKDIVTYGARIIILYL